ncbi:MAG: sigma-54 dependent transcriptional regulator [Candidatus Omnitrophota bacterium]
MRTILIIDDDASSREVVRESLEGKGYEFLEAESGEKAIEVFSLFDIDLVICDILMPGMDGIEVLRQIKEIKPDTQVLMLTALNEVDTAVEAMRLGAINYITKPFRLKEIQVVVDRALEQKKLVEEREEWRRQISHFSGRLLGKSPAMQSIFHIIEQVAPTRSTVLITGETGTGKEQVAREIHEQSRRHNRPMIKVDCASLPESLLESELFGQIQGSFIGAYKNRKSRFELADDGTIFLNKIGEMCVSTQKKLLNFLQNSELEIEGSSANIHLDVRVIAATNKDLQQRITEQKFRVDLYYHLRAIQITVPPLRERRDDIPILAQTFLKLYNEEFGKTLDQFSNEVMDKFYSYSWPGNVRELQHAVEHACIFAKGSSITLCDIPEEIRSKSKFSFIKSNTQQINEENEIVIPLGTTMEDAESEIIRQTLKCVKGNKEEAARVLGLSRSSLYRRIPTIQPEESK